MQTSDTPRVAIYARSAVGSATSQLEELTRAVGASDTRRLVAAYSDPDVSGLTYLGDRNGGRQLLTDAARAGFEELWITEASRLGRDELGAEQAFTELASHGVDVFVVRTTANGTLQQRRLGS